MQVEKVYVVYEIDGGGLGSHVAIMAVKHSKLEAERFGKTLSHNFFDIQEKNAIIESTDDGERVYLLDRPPTRFGEFSR